jgi:hypothetical protein
MCEHDFDGVSGNFFSLNFSTAQTPSLAIFRCPRHKHSGRNSKVAMPDRPGVGEDSLARREVSRKNWPRSVPIDGLNPLQHIAI